ncbi:MAG: hybrid sensor histidine kinase/response regulator [Desulfobacter postgatei]|uniref:histidine kinase n=1 Tax=Desulfobacter postgatei TaxID=2293 RepID=A0A2G6MTR3_9BACT|nr:MAG: hybrid sensor histidine kinase/response regulator [Desulfobacter postgatei]
MEHITTATRFEKTDAVEALANGIAHDVNNLLTAIKGHASMILNNVNPTDPLYSHLLEIISNVDMGSDLATQLLGFARADEVYLTRMDANRLVRSVVETLNLKGRRIILDVSLDTKPLIIKGDPEKIKQVVLAIVNNALQAMPEGGKLSVRTEAAAILNGTADVFGVESGFFCKITISDTGIGMDIDTLEKIFNAFYSHDHDQFPEKKGLGLTFAKKIVKHHDGVIDVWSSLNVGTSFSIILPLAEHNHIDDTPSIQEELKLGHESVLLVDDEQRILDVGRTICKALGYTVFTADSGKDAVKIYAEKKNDINIVVLDMIMPGMGGLDVFIALKQLNPDIKVLLSTGYVIDENAQEMLRQGCKGYILKPYSMMDFSHKLRDVLG